MLGQSVPLPSYFSEAEIANAQLLASQVTTGTTTATAQLFDAQSFPVVRSPNYVGNAGFAGFNGSGVSVVVIDSGADLDNPLFGPDLNIDGVGDRIVQQFDFSGTNDNNANDLDGHGTNVAGIIAEMAPGVNLIIHKVVPDAGGGVALGDIQESLQWIIANRAAFNIVALNMSLGFGNFQNTLAPAGDVINDEFDLLSTLRVSVVASAGNDFFNLGSVQGVAYPASLAGAIAVGATYDANVGVRNYLNGASDGATAADRIVSFSQRHGTLLDLLAPGAIITSAGLNGATNVGQSGTSQAAPHVAAAAAMLQDMALTQRGQALTQAGLVTALRNTGVAIVDGDDEVDNVTNTNLTYRRLDVLAAGYNLYTPESVTLAAASDSGFSNSDRVTNISTPTFTGTVPANSFVRLYVDGVERGSQPTGSTGQYSITTTALNDGSRSVTIRVAENSAVALANMSNPSVALAVMIDTMAPSAPSIPDLQAAFDSGSSNIDNITNIAAPRFSGTSEANALITLFDGANVLVANQSATGSNWTITSPTLTSSSHSIKARATDLAGNVSATDSPVLSVTIDTIAPSAPSIPDLLTADDSGFSNTDNITNFAAPRFSGTSEANALITLFDGANVLVANQPATGSNWTITSPTLTSSSHSIKARATDLAGNVSATDSPVLSVTIDTIAPSLRRSPTS